MISLTKLMIYDYDEGQGPGTDWYQRHNALVEIIEAIINADDIDFVREKAKAVLRRWV